MLEDVVGTSVGLAHRGNVGSRGILARCQPGTSAPCRLHIAGEPDHLMEHIQWGEDEDERQEGSSGSLASEMAR